MIQETEEQLLVKFQFVNGYYDTDLLAAPANTLARGSKNLLITDNDSLRVFRGVKDTGLLGGRTMFVVANGYAALTDNGATLGIGSIFNYISESLFWIGEGKVIFNGQILTDTATGLPFTATSNLQLSPKSGSTYLRAYAAGLNQPSAPTCAPMTPSAAFTGLLRGLYSFKIARVRATTGGRSIASPTSAVILCSNQTARLTFPLPDANGQDRWAIFATKAGFGGTGVHYLVKEISESNLSTVGGVPRSYEVEFTDADLLPITAYIDDYPPPSGAFAARLENYVVVVGAYDNAVAISIRNFPESFHPEHLAFLPKRPTAVLADPQGNYLYISTESGVYALAVAPAAFDNPMIMQTVWSDTGVASPHNWCAYEGVIFAFVSRQGAVTMDSLGRPSSEFAKPVARLMRDWVIENVRVFACPDIKSVIYTHEGDAIAFNVQNLKWSPPAKVSDFSPGDIISGVILNRRLKITLFRDGVFKLFEFDEQTVGTYTNFIARSPDIELNPAGGRANIFGLKGNFYAPEYGNTSLSVFCDYDQIATKTLVHGTNTAGMQTTRMANWALFRKEAVAVSVEGIQSDFTKDCYPAGIYLFGTAEESTNFNNGEPVIVDLIINLLDDDGAFLTDADGAYLYEAV